jgi:hypothetical protein
MLIHLIKHDVLSNKYRVKYLSSCISRINHEFRIKNAQLHADNLNTMDVVGNSS